ncbi:MAG: hypothetical protein IJ268_10000, partial [Proteobacteria bacterium]|nr:hypothetical protein [Pseudomonadota bacterium]
MRITEPNDMIKQNRKGAQSKKVFWLLFWPKHPGCQSSVLRGYLRYAARWREPMPVDIRPRYFFWG